MWMKKHQHLRTVGDGSDYTAVNKVHIHNRQIRDILNATEYNLVGEIRKICDRVVYPEMTILTEWAIGSKQDPHVDLYSNHDIQVGDDQPSLPREWTCIINLNDEYRDGRTFFPQSEHNPELIEIEPETGSGILFQGIHHLHGVETIRGCPRYTIAIWFTSDLDKIMWDSPIKDLSIDHVKIRHPQP